MITFKCKMCGGDLEFEQGASVAECPYCGTTQTLPKLDNDKRANLYDRANHFRRQNEYDKAMAIYEQILQEDRTDAEAYWSLVLCRYGIEYVEDPVSHKRVPTVNRVQYASILADEDYKSALQYADIIQRGVYEAEANTIAEIQKGILDISKQEKPFDVFICYKETDANGRRTPDSVLANDMYHQLTKEGFKVFFSRITLEDKIGTAYEPYIFAALNSAKVMVVLGTKPEYFNAVWVKNEWSRYLALIRNGADKTLVPAYRDMDPYDLPEEFAHLQAQDMGKLGFMQDLIHGIKKLISLDELKSEPKVQSSPVSSVTPLIERAFIFLEDGEFILADDFFEKALNLDPKNGHAYLGKLMVRLKVEKFDDLKNQAQPFDNDRDYQKIMRFGDAGLKQRLHDCIDSINRRNEYQKQKGLFDLAVKALNDALTEEDVIKARQQFEAISGFDGACEMLKECDTKQLKLKKAITKAAHKRRIRFIISGFMIVLLVAYVIASKTSFPKMHYEKGLALRSLGQYNSAISEFSLAGNYNNAEEILRATYYDMGVSLKEANQYEDAIAAFTLADDYSDSPKQLKESYYYMGVALKEANRYEEAISALKSAGSYNDAEKQLKKTYFDMGIDLRAAGHFEKAITAFKSAGNFDDANEQLAETYYSMGVALRTDGKFEEARTAFISAGNYRDAEIQISATFYDQAVLLQAQGDIYGALASFRSAGRKYEDSSSRITELERLTTSRISAYEDYSVGLKQNGTVIAVGNNVHGCCNVNEWHDIIAIAAGNEHTVGLKADGSVVAVGNKGLLSCGECDVDDWHDIVAVAAGGNTVGLKANGTVTTAGNSMYAPKNISDWHDIVAIASGFQHTVGLRADGTVVAGGSNSGGCCNVEEWCDIISIAAGSDHTFGLKADGTVVYAGKKGGFLYFGECDVDDWSDIVAIAAGNNHTVGIKKDGTVVAVGFNSYGQCNVEGWSDIIAVAAGSDHTVGLKSDGTIVSTGSNKKGQCDLSDFQLWS